MLVLYVDIVSAVLRHRDSLPCWWTGDEHVPDYLDVDMTDLEIGQV
jgi:hypothetical protein